MKSLYTAFSKLKSEEEFTLFLKDLCTPKEIKDLAERWVIAQLLYENKLSYRQIAQETKTSATTVARVARFLKDEPNQAYSLILKRIHHHA